MHYRFRWTFLLTLVVASLVAAPIAVTATELETGLHSFQLRGDRTGKGSTESAGGTSSSLIMFERSFAPVMEGLGVIDARSRSMVGGHYIDTPSGYMNINRLVAGEYPLHFSSGLVDSIAPTDVALAVFGDATMETIREAVQMAGVRTLGSVPNSGIVVTGVTDSGMATLTRFGAQLFLWVPGNFVSPLIGMSPVPNPDMALDTKLNMIASVFPGEDVQVAMDALTAIGATVQSQHNGYISFLMEIDALRDNLGQLGGLPFRGISEQGFAISADEDTAGTLQIAEWRNGARPYTDAGIDGSTQVVGVTDTGLGLDTAVMGDSATGGDLGSASTAAGLGHRKVVAYVTAASVAGGGGDLLTCDGTTGATHGHVVASLIAGNAQDSIPDIRFVSGFEPNVAGTQTTHAVDGMAPQARVYFIDDQVVTQCADPLQIEAQSPGTLSASVAAAQTFGTSNGLDLKIHNFALSYVGTEAWYDSAAQDLDTWLQNNQDFLVVVAAGNQGVDSIGDYNLDFGTVTSPGTAKNVVTVGASGTINNPLDPSLNRIPQVPNNGQEIIARFANANGPGQGPAAFTLDGNGATNWRIKPDVMANGDEVMGADNVRLNSPTTCISGDDDNIGPIECSRLRVGTFDGTSFSAAGVSGVAAMVRDYYAKGYYPGGQAGGSIAKSLTGPEMKAALIASADLMTGTSQWRQVGPQLWVAFYNPKHLSTFSPEQGYGRVQVDKLLPLGSEPGTPSFIQSQMVTVALAGTTSQTFSVINPDEPLRCAAAWYDLEATNTGPGAQGNLVRDVNMTMWDCGPDGICANSDDTRYNGNYFSEDANYDGALLNLAATYSCSNNATIACNPVPWDATIALAVCGDAGATCNLDTPAITEDCNQDGLLTFSEFSLPVPPGGFVAGSPDCASAGIDSNNSNEAVFLSPDQLTQGRAMRVDLSWVSSTEGSPPASIDVALVCTGGLSVPGLPNSIRGNRPEFTCSDVLEVSVLDGAENATTGGVEANTQVESIDCLTDTDADGDNCGDGDDLLIDTEALLIFTETALGTRYLSDPLAIVDAATIPPTNDDQLVSVADGGQIVMTYADSPTPSAFASATIRCQPSLGINNIVRRGYNSNFGITGGCDPRGRIDPRFVGFSAIIGTGTMVSGDLFLDAYEDLVYTVNFTNQEEGDPLLDVTATLKACVPGTVLPDGSCTLFTGIEQFDGPLASLGIGTQKMGTVVAGLTQSASFNIHVKPTVTFPEQVEMLFGVQAAKNGLTVANTTTFHHVLDADTWSFAREDPAVSGATYYSTDFPEGGREIKVYAQEWYDPLVWSLAAETYLFGDMTSSAFCADANPRADILCGNSQLMGFNPVTEKFDTPIVNTMPWAFDIGDPNDPAFDPNYPIGDGWAQRRRFDSDAGANLQLNNENVWQWNYSGECGFQSNLRDVQVDGQQGTGGMWHTGFAQGMPACPDPRVPGDEPCTPIDRTGYDLGCENYDVPGSPNPKREFVVDVVSSPHFFRVKQQTDSNGFAYQLEFTRYGFNLAPDVPDGNAIMGYKLDPDTTTSQPVDPLDFGWLGSDQGSTGFLSGVAQGSYPAFNPNNPHELGSALQDANTGYLNEIQGDPNQNINEIHGHGSNGSWYDPNDVNKLGGGVRTLDDANGKSGTRGWNFLGPATRGSAGLPVRNWDESWEMGQQNFEDIYGPNETRDPGQTYPICKTGGLPVPGCSNNVELLLNRRDSFQASLQAYLREEEDPNVATLSGYGIGFDDVVVEWREQHPVEDRTPCNDPAGLGAGHAPWAQDPDSGLYVGSENNPPTTYAAGCAAISWDRFTILVPELSAELTVIDSNAQVGPNRLAGDADDQAVDSDGDGFAELTVPAWSDIDPTGEFITLTQVEFASPVYKGVVKLSSTKGLTSATDGVVFIQQNGDGTAPVFVSAQYNDADINASGVFGDNVPCPDNPLIDTMQTAFVGSDVLYVTATVEDVGPNADGDSIADPGETIMMDISVVNSTLDLQREKPDLEEATITLVASSANVGPTQPISCILDGSSYFGTLPSGIAVFNSPSDRYSWVVGDVTRTSPTEVLQAQFSLGISARYTDSLGLENNVSSFRTPQRFAVNVDLDIDPNFPAAPLKGDKACVGGTNSGTACTIQAECPGFKGDGVTLADCEDLPAYLQTGGTGFIAGEVGYFEGFEGAVNPFPRSVTTGPWPKPILGTSFTHAPAIGAPGAGGYVDGNTAVSYLPGPLSPSAIPGNGPDVPEGSTGTDGSRCQYNDPFGPGKFSSLYCNSWEGSGWHANDSKGFSGIMSMYNGIDGRFEGAVAGGSQYDSSWTTSLYTAFSGPVNVGVAGNATLSIYHIVSGADDRTFNVPAGNAVGRGYIEWTEVDVTGKPIIGWTKLAGFQNNYGNTGVTPFFGLCIFEHYDDFYDAAAALGGKPGWNPAALNNVLTPYNADDVASEDDYFDPNDPLRNFGPSSSCFPSFVYSSLGDYTSSNINNVGKAFTTGELGNNGTGVWINSLFNLDSAGGKKIRLRFAWSDIEFPPAEPWTDIFGAGIGQGTRGWRLDDIAMSGLTDVPLVLIPDARPVGTDECPIDPDPGTPGNQAACGSVTANAGLDVLTPVSGFTVTLDASASVADRCVDGFLEFRWRIGGATVQDYSTNPVLVDAPSLTTVYSLDVRCSTDPTCQGTDSVVVVPADEREASGSPAGLGSVVGAPGIIGNQTVTTTWSEPQVYGPFALDVLGFDLQRGGFSLRSAGVLGANLSGSLMATALRNDACALGAATGPGVGGSWTYTDTTYTGVNGLAFTPACSNKNWVSCTPGPGFDPIVDCGDPLGLASCVFVPEQVGYLSVATSTASGIIGSLGNGELIGADALTQGRYGRGRVTPTAPPLPTCP